MHTVHAPKSKVIKFTVGTPKNVPTGHQPHRSGSGPHTNNKAKRQRTRNSQFRVAIRD